jgi:glycosyltransferase involved in cell wall biosynthesis
LNRQLEADDIATKLSKASILHFHTVCGRERFLQYRPEFESRSISIPFFLPYLTQDAKDRNDTSANDEIVILFVGYDGIRKGITDLIKSINRLGDQYIKSYSLRFIVVTRDRPQCDFPIEWYSKLPRERVLDFMEMADIFVLVPDRESYGLVIIEAMNAGCAVIVDDDVTRKEIVGDAGVFVSPGNVEMLTEAIGLLVKDQTLRQRMQAAAMDRVRTVFLPATVGRQYENAFKALV